MAEDDGFEAAKRATVHAFPPPPQQGEFRLGRTAVHVEIPPKEEGGEPEPRWLCSRLEVAAETRDHRGEAWGRLLVVTDRDGTAHEWAMPMEMLGGDGTDYRRRLLSLGLEIAPGRWAREMLHKYISIWRPRQRARCVERTGWHDGGVYVLPDGAFGAPPDERVLLQVAAGAVEPRICGTLEGWQEGVAAPAVGNSRLVFAISAAFAPPLLKLIGEPSGGVHFRGDSSTGKTTCLLASTSVWGLSKGSWRTTDNASELLAANACDALLGLDEIAEATPKVVDALSYMLANGRGKARMSRDAALRRPLEWRVLFFSTGEVGLPEKLAEAGLKPRAGQAVRVVEIPADAGCGRGAFEDIHGTATAREFADAIGAAAEVHQGHAARAFLEALVSDVGTFTATARDARDKWLQQCLANHPDADGQVQRAAKRFGLIAAAGALATALEILPWEEDTAFNAATACFEAWLAHRGGTGPHEVREGIAQVRHFIERHGMDRFEAPWEKVRTDRDNNPIEQRVLNRAGFRRKAAEAESWEWLVLPEVWRQEVCKGHDANRIARALAERGYAELGEGKNLMKKMRVPGQSEPRFMHLKPSLLDGEEGDR